MWRGWEDAKLNAKWFREFMAYDPCVDLAVTTPADARPRRIIRGLQAPPEDLDAIAATRTTPVETVLIEGLSHILRRQDAPSLQAYKKDVRRPIDPTWSTAWWRGAPAFRSDPAGSRFQSASTGTRVFCPLTMRHSSPTRCQR